MTPISSRATAQSFRANAPRLGLRFVALGYLFALLAAPVGLVFYRTFEHGFSAAWQAVTTPDALHAFWLTILMVLVAVPLNTIFGVTCALLIVRHKFPGRWLLNALIDLPFAISPVVIGLALILVYGQAGWFGDWLAQQGIQVTEDLHQLVRTNSLATIETEGLVGGSYLGIATGTEAAKPVEPNATLAGREPFEITDLMVQMSDTIAKVNNTIDAMKGDMERAVVGIANTVDNANALLTAASADLKLMAASGAKMTADAAEITEGIRSGKGSLGKLVNDDEFYNRATAIARQTEDIATSARQVIETAKRTLEGFQSKDGPVQGMSASVTQTMDDARLAMAGLAENMDAMKQNFLLRGFFKKRGIQPRAAVAGGLSEGRSHERQRSPPGPRVAAVRRAV